MKRKRSVFAEDFGGERYRTRGFCTYFQGKSEVVLGSLDVIAVDDDDDREYRWMSLNNSCKPLLRSSGPMTPWLVLVEREVAHLRF